MPLFFYANCNYDLFNHQVFASIHELFIINLQIFVNFKRFSIDSFAESQLIFFYLLDSKFYFSLNRSRKWKFLLSVFNDSWIELIFKLNNDIVFLLNLRLQYFYCCCESGVVYGELLTVRRKLTETCQQLHVLLSWVASHNVRNYSSFIQNDIFYSYELHLNRCLHYLRHRRTIKELCYYCLFAEIDFQRQFLAKRSIQASSKIALCGKIHWPKF